MKNKELLLIDSPEDLTKLIGNLKDDITIYGAGTIARKFALQIRSYYGNLDKIQAFCVTHVDNESQIFGKPILQYDNISPKNVKEIIVALGRKARGEVINSLENYKGNLVVIDSNVLNNYDNQEIYYEDCIEDVREFLDRSDYNVSQLKETTVDADTKLYAWTCWWQGEEEAPELVKACINSQKKNLPSEVEHIVITEKNCESYVHFPERIIKKVQDGSITLTTFSDMLREKLLYEYGGVWFDATVLIHKPFPIDYFRLPLYTCKGKEYHFSSYSHWSLWCMGGVKKNSIFKFLFDLFCVYYKYQEKIKYYLTVDYFIKAAMEYVVGAKELYDDIPYNNEGADRLATYLKDEYSPTLYAELTKNTYLSKLTTKHFDGRNGADFQGFSKTSIYSYIINQYL